MSNVIRVTKQPIYGSTKYGIILSRTASGQDNQYRNKIERNLIIVHNFETLVRGAIKVNGFPGTRDKMLIDSNTVEMGTGGTDSDPTKFIDIYVNSADNFVVTRNTIRSSNTFATGRSRWGFFPHDGDINPVEGNIFSYNNLYGLDIHDDGFCAVHAVNAGPWSICNNTTDKTYRGFHFTGKCGPSSFGLNTIKDHSKIPQTGFVSAGLILNAGDGNFALLGDQVCQGNNWTMTEYPGGDAYTAVHWGSGISLNMNEFLVEDINDPHQAPTDRSPGGTNWFKLGTDCLQTPTDCTGQKPAKIDEHDEWVRSTYPQPQASPNVGEWQNTRSLMAKLMRYPNLATGDVLAFKNAYTQSSAALFARFDSLMNATSSASAGSQTNLNNLEASIQSKQAQINTLDASITDFYNLEPGLLSSRAVLLGELAALSAQRSSLRAQNTSAKEPLLLACEQFNNALPANQVYEQNQKLLNALAIQQARGIELSQANKDALHAIAQQCIQVAGCTRSAAASMLPAEEGAQYWRENSEEYNCPQRGERNADIQDIGFSLSPNPCSDFLRVQFEAPFVGELVISDLSGRVVQRLPVKDKSQVLSIPVGQLNNGVYLLSYTGSTGKLSTNAKFVVLR